MTEAIEYVDDHGRVLKVPSVGDGVTYGSGSDCYPATVTNVWTEGGKVHVSYRGDEYSYNRETGEETFTPNPRRPEMTYRLEKAAGCYRDGEYSKVNVYHHWHSVHRNDATGRWNKSSSRGSVSFGQRRYHMDPHF